MRFYVAIILAVAIAIESRAATNGGQAAPGGTESIGGRLLDDLPPDAGRPKTSPLPAQNPRDTKAIEDALKSSSPLIGFGVNPNPTAQPLVRVQQGMQHAQSLIAQPGANAKPGAKQLAGPVQQEVLADLDKLIAQLSKQCQCSGGQCQGGQCNQPPKPNPNSQPKPGKPGSALGQGKSSARDSTDRLDRTTTKPVDKGQVDEMVKALWGNLPERSREQMLQSFSDEFLPKYELEIEQYYRRLSEEQTNSTPK
jgi:hypothetical protein